MTYDPNLQLSTHFKLFEFVISETGERKGIDNTPTDQIVGHSGRSASQYWSLRVCNSGRCT